MSKECHHCLLKLYCGRRISFGQCTSSHSLKEEVVEVMPAMGPPGHCCSFFFVVVVFCSLSLYSLFNRNELDVLGICIKSRKITRIYNGALNQKTESTFSTWFLAGIIS